MINQWWHKIEHLFGWHECAPYFFERSEDTMLGWKCKQCGDIEDISEVADKVGCFDANIWADKIRDFLLEDEHPHPNGDPFTGFDKGLQPTYNTGGHTPVKNPNQITYCDCQEPNIFMVEEYCRDCEAIVRRVIVTHLEGYEWPHKEWTPVEARVLKVSADGNTYWVRSEYSGKEYKLTKDQIEEL